MRLRSPLVGIAAFTLVQGCAGDLRTMAGEPKDPTIAPTATTEGNEERSAEATEPADPGDADDEMTATPRIEDPVAPEEPVDNPDTVRRAPDLPDAPPEGTLDEVVALTGRGLHVPEILVFDGLMILLIRYENAPERFGIFLKNADDKEWWLRDTLIVEGLREVHMAVDPRHEAVWCYGNATDASGAASGFLALYGGDFEGGLRVLQRDLPELRAHQFFEHVDDPHVVLHGTDASVGQHTWEWGYESLATGLNPHVEPAYGFLPDGYDGAEIVHDITASGSILGIVGPAGRYAAVVLEIEGNDPVELFRRTLTREGSLAIGGMTVDSDNPSHIYIAIERTNADGVVTSAVHRIGGS